MKVGFKGVYISLTCFPRVSHTTHKILLKYGTVRFTTIFTKSFNGTANQETLDFYSEISENYYRLRFIL